MGKVLLAILITISDFCGVVIGIVIGILFIPCIILNLMKHRASCVISCYELIRKCHNFLNSVFMVVFITSYPTPPHPTVHRPPIIATPC